MTTYNITDLNVLVGKWSWRAENGACSWETMTMPKYKGGLSCRDLKLLNMALLAHQAWRLLQDASLWARGFWRQRIFLVLIFFQRYLVHTLHIFGGTFVRGGGCPSRRSHHRNCGWMNDECLEWQTDTKRFLYKCVLSQWSSYSGL